VIEGDAATTLERDASRGGTPLVCVVVPCFNEAPVVAALLAELTAVIRAAPFPMRALFVDDGSTDGTGEALARACAGDDRFALLRLSRNFGHQAAVSAGLRHADGDLVAVIDADLQDPPSVIPAMVERWRDGYDVVYGVRRDRKEGVLTRAAYALFYRLLRRVADIDIPLDAGDFSLMDRKVVDALNALPERSRFVRGLRSWVGFRQVGLAYERSARSAGRSKYGFGRLLALALDGLVSFSWLPLRLASLVGAVSAGIAAAYLAWALVERVFLAQTPPGWASLVGVFVFLGGIQLVVLGIIGEYLGRVFDEVKGRPPYLVAGSSGWVGSATRRG
jgi:dolichol-phosphate mannosyltransferase